MADPVAIVSVMSSAAVAIAVPIVTGRREDARLRWQTKVSRADDLRDVVEAVAMHAVAAERAVNAASGAEDHDVREGIIGKRSEDFRNLYDDDARLGIRVGTERPIYEAYVELYGVLYEARAELMSEDYRPDDDAIEKQHVEILAAQAKFLDAAAELVGELPD